MVQLLAAGAVLLLLLLAAWQDLALRIIPDILTLGILLLALALRGTAGPAAVLASLLVGALLFLLLLGAALRGWLGGGDVKLAAALAVALPPAAAPDFITGTVLAGGVLGLLYLAGPRLAPGLLRAAATAPRPLARILAVEAWRLRRRGPVPYGVAIAAGGALQLLQGAAG